MPVGPNEGYPSSGSSFQTCLPRGSEPHRDGSLDRLWGDREILARIELALEGEGVFRPRLIYDRQVFVRPRSSVLPVIAETSELFVAVGSCYPKSEPPVGNVVDHGRALRCFDGVMERKKVAASGDSQVLGASSDRRRRGEERRVHPVIEEVMLDQGDVVKSKFVSEFGLFEAFFVKLGVGLAGTDRILKRIGKAEFHALLESASANISRPSRLGSLVQTKFKWTPNVRKNQRGDQAVVRRIDINCDMGESYGNFRIGNDEKIMPLITSANVACGFHGGDPGTMESNVG